MDEQYRAMEQERSSTTYTWVDFARVVCNATVLEAGIKDSTNTAAGPMLSHDGVGAGEEGRVVSHDMVLGQNKNKGRRGVSSERGRIGHQRSRCGVMMVSRVVGGGSNREGAAENRLCIVTLV